MDYQHMSEDSSTSGSLTSDNQSPRLPVRSSPEPAAEDKPDTLDLELDTDTNTTHRVVSETQKSSPVSVTGITTSASLKSPAANGNTTQSSGDKPLVGNIMTSSQAIKRHSSSYEQVKGLGVDSDVDNRVSDLKNFECPAGDRYIEHETNLEHVRSLIRRYIEHIAFRAFTLILIIVDLSIVVAALVIAPPNNKDLPDDVKRTTHNLDYVALVFSCYFMVEVMLRIFAQRPRVFFRQILEIIDAFVVLVSFIVVIVDLSIEFSSLNNPEETGYLKLIQAGRLVRLVRFGMLVRVIFTQRKHIARASRLMVSENKRRYQKDGYDLDLCYITDRVIAMSFPSEGFMSIYRNPIEEVSRFFNDKYPNKYRIYNCCSERTYDADKYFNSSMQRLMIDDHNVPSLHVMAGFVRDVQEWMNMSRENVIAIHCKGGKGRTGTMICTWLLHAGAFTSANDALDYFASRRTDLSVGSKFQGVETPSQSRYVNYFEKMITAHESKVPAEIPLKCTKISVSGLKGIGTGDGRDLIVKFLVKGDLAYEARFGTDTNCTTIFERESSQITASLMNAPLLSGDVKVRFEATSNIPCDYDDCPWFFWFNTSFIENNELILGREDLDNPHKEKTWKLYKPDFRVTLSFSADA